MTEQALSESALLDIKNSELQARLLGSKDIANLLKQFESVTGYKIASEDGFQEVQGIPATGELVYKERSNQIEILAIKFRGNGEIILSQKESNFRTRYNPETFVVYRYNPTTPSIPEQILPRHAKYNFLTKVLHCQELIINLMKGREST